jgi:RsmE family RNA methyltransferase|tara:strand:- start:535 stop:1251 length:717 start_codon:yes stop_codon:yes gene_type:complete
MNILVLDNEDFLGESKDIVKLYGRRAKHILGIKKATIGSSIKAGLLNGNSGVAILKDIDSESVTLKVSLKVQPSPLLPLSIILALPRPKMLRRILQTIASLGIKKMYLLNTCKVEKSYWQSPQLDKINIRKELLLGLEQASETLIPEIVIKKRFKPFVEDELPSIVRGTQTLIAHPCTTKYFPKEIKKSTLIAIGPEGGFTDYEFQKFTSIGFEHLSLGKRTLRVETVIPFLAGKLFF